jgi:hypothetical protein
MNNEQKPFVIIDADTAASRKVTVSNPSWAPDIVRVEFENLTILHLSWEDAQRLADQLRVAAYHAENIDARKSKAI